MKTVSYFCGIVLLCFGLRADAQIGDPAPDFTVTDTHGGMHRLYDYLDAGKTVVLDFFYTTCIPCQFYTPQVNLAFEKYGCNDADVIFMAIDYNDTDAEVVAYDAEYEIMYPSVSGLNGGGNGVVNAYGISGFPTFYVIDSTREIVEVIDPPTLQVFDFRFNLLGIEPMDCGTSPVSSAARIGQLSVFPNPVSGDEISLVLQKSESHTGMYEITDITGALMQSGTICSTAAEGIRIGVGDLPHGIYTIRVMGESSDRVFAGRFMR